MTNSLVQKLTRLLLPALAVAALGSVGCAAQTLDDDNEGEEVATAEEALVTLKTVGPYGSTAGTMTGPGNDQVTPITKIAVWAGPDYVHGVRFFWGKKQFTWGTTTIGQKTVVLLSLGEYVSQVFVDVDPQGILRGISFDSNIVEGILTVGYIGDRLFPVLTGTNRKLTDMTAYTSSFGGNLSIAGAKFHYTTE